MLCAVLMLFGYIRSWLWHVGNSLRDAGYFTVVTDLLAVARSLSRSESYGIPVSQPRTEPASPALYGRFLNTGPPE